MTDCLHGCSDDDCGLCKPVPEAIKRKAQGFIPRSWRERERRNYEAARALLPPDDVLTVNGEEVGVVVGTAFEEPEEAPDDEAHQREPVAVVTLRNSWPEARALAVEAVEQHIDNPHEA